MKRKLFFLTAIFSFVCAFSFAQSFYVTSGGDDLNDGSNNTDQALATIQKAHDLASDGNTINVGAGTYTETIIISKNLTIIGDSANNTFVEANASAPDNAGTGGSSTSRAFDLGSSKSLSLKNLTIRNGNVTSGAGGAVFVRSNCTLTTESCNFSNNYAQWSGSVIGSYGNLVLKKTTFSGNYTLGSGAISAEGVGKTNSIENCTFYNNHSNGKGGAISLSKGTTSINNCTLALNTSGTEYKAIQMASPAILSQFNNNFLLNSGASDYDLNREYTEGYEPYTDASSTNNIISRSKWFSDGLVDDPGSTTGVANVTEANVFGTIVLADNGGGINTISINSGSIAENAADASTATSTDARGYAANGVRDIGAFELGGTLSVAKNTTLKGVSIAPNPSNGTFNIYNLDADTYELTVYGLNSAVLFNTTQSSKNIQLPSNIKGLVFIKVAVENNTKVFKHLIKQDI